jgi:hypothetical protein
MRMDRTESAGATPARLKGSLDRLSLLWLGLCGGVFVALCVVSRHFVADDAYTARVVRTRGAFVSYCFSSKGVATTWG